MPVENTLGKVAAFITRSTAAGRELLVFSRPKAGVQLPAGTMEAGETPEVAVMREAREESGLNALRIIRHLETIPQGFEPNDRMLLEPYTLITSLGAVPLTRGFHVQVVGSAGDEDDVCYEFTRDEQGRFQPDMRSRGSIPRRLLTTDVTRHLFHLTATANTPERWSVEADRHTFSLYWTPLRRDVGLIPQQARWLDLVYERLAEA